MLWDGEKKTVVNFEFVPDTVTVNGTEFAIGSTITYTLTVAGVANGNVAGVAGSITYDDSILTFVSADLSSLGVAEGSEKTGYNTIHNEVDGTIYYIASDIQYGFNFSEASQIITVTFKVVGNDGDTLDITYEIAEMFNMELEDIFLNGTKLDDAVTVTGTVAEVTP